MEFVLATPNRYDQVEVALFGKVARLTFTAYVNLRTQGYSQRNRDKKIYVAGFGVETPRPALPGWPVDWLKVTGSTSGMRGAIKPQRS
jgi:hypothetical protein